MTALLRGHDAGHEYLYGGNSATDDLRHEHALILRAVTVAEALAAAAGSLDRGRLGRLVTFLTRFADRCHHAKEEEHLFVALARRGCRRTAGRSPRFGPTTPRRARSSPRWPAPTTPS